jgi:hypothetical protein
VPINFTWEFGGKRVYIVVMEDGEESLREKMTLTNGACGELEMGENIVFETTIVTFSTKNLIFI